MKVVAWIPYKQICVIPLTLAFKGGIPVHIDALMIIYL